MAGDLPVKALSMALAGCIAFLIGTTQPAYGMSVETIDLLDSPTVTNLAGEKITELTHGQQALIEIAGRDTTGKPQHFAVIVEVRDGNGFTESMTWQEGTVEPNGDFEMQFSWMPRQTCEFYQECEKREIRTFVLSSLTNPSALTSIYTTYGITLLGIPTDIPRLNQNYSVLLHDRTYNVTYSFHKGSGTITNVDVDREARTLALSVETRRDSQLVMDISKPLVDYSITRSTQESVELYVLVDGKDTPFTLLYDFDSIVTYVVNIDKGAKEVILGGRLPQNSAPA
ncbi:hypothetical protein [Candidatus Nitrososphaera sp. FF02]|uniref:hypothetical protein n=1 Tax=Candidatus Nitrososphaera sp. FF02 TaxID=3398226 RepID=UPI0039E7C149